MSSPIDSQAIKAALARPNYIPLDITAALLEESRDKSAIVAILFVGALVYVFVALRSYARVFITKHFGLDDWLALLTLILYTAFIALCIVLIHLGSGRHFAYIEYIMTNAVQNTTEVLDFVAHIVYTTALLACRLSGLAFYARIADRHGRLTWWIRGAAVFMICGYLPQLFLIVFHCLPVTGYWPYSFQAEVNNFTCLAWGEVYVTNSVISLICDMILFTIPATIVAQLKISRAGKLKLFCILMPGLLVIAISCARMYLVIVGQWDVDESWSYDPLLAVESSEIGSTLIALSIPALKPFFGSVFAFLDRTFVSTPRPDWYHPSGPTTGASQRNETRVIELDKYAAGAESRVAIAVQPATRSPQPSTAHSGASTGASDEKAYAPVDWVKYTATASRGGHTRSPSVRSNLSQTPMIRYQQDYTVSREAAPSATYVT
ncbi:hypothetical protein LTR36_009833 [Oleoguttula mirabilis]|uniref:Rhodopsin domain-containing protein n=1 Tax=Oleoguttula mirabilis TaxID=1507867 RepID=A0AAV9J4W6_9PEZI|nr:hypothetical protein LTR36_009833 [Oleoguttula mirabilis]